MTAGGTVPLQEAAVEGTLFFLPLPQLLELLNLPLPAGPSEPSEASAPYWPAHAQWQRLLADGLFEHPAARDYWQRRLEEERTLACQLLPELDSGLDKLRCLAHSPLATELGCPPAGERLRRHLQTPEIDADTLLESELVLESRLADVFAVALRLAAWRVVDLSLQHWEQLNQNGEQDEVLLETFLPTFDSASGQWSNPVEDYLAHLATLGGCPEPQPNGSGLARLWAGEGANVLARERLLGDWREGRRRPTALALTGLMDAVLRRILGEGSGEGDLALNRQLLCESFRFAESCAYLQRTLSRLGMADGAIAEIFAVYRREYCRARAVLDRPLPEDRGRL